MGKFQSKIASKRRQSPEGGSLTSNVLTCQRELERIHIHKSKLTENLYVELRENRSDRNCNRNVVLPLKKTPETDKSIYVKVNKHMKRKKGHAGDTECHTVPEEDSRQEWVFTLYNFDNSGKASKEDMSSLIHSMYEVLEASVKQPGHTPLKIKLAVTPTACPDKISQTEKGQSTPQKAGNPVRKLYCVDENIERRNHYLDLAGIENYTSKFDNTESPSQEPTQYTHSAVQHHTVVERGNCFSDSPRGLSGLHSLKSKATSVRNDRCREDGKFYKHPASRCHLTPSHPPAHSVLQRSHSKRLHSRVQDARPTPGVDRDILSSLQPSCGVRLVQRHKHHHHHEHHHHHHYHPA